MTDAERVKLLEDVLKGILGLCRHTCPEGAMETVREVQARASAAFTKERG